jgi:hypothetical protein
MVNPIPNGYHTVTPYLIVEGADELIEFVKQAFGGQEQYRMAASDGSIGHAQVQIGDSVVMLADASEQYPATSSQLHLYVGDCDATYHELSRPARARRGSRQTSSTAIARPLSRIRLESHGRSRPTSRTSPKRRWRGGLRRRGPHGSRDGLISHA